jgi:uncharacterized protein CbrC (UPF0167 family)
MTICNLTSVKFDVSKCTMDRDLCICSAFGNTIVFSFNKHDTFVQQYLYYSYGMNVKVDVIIRTPQYSSFENTSWFVYCIYKDAFVLTGL